MIRTNLHIAGRIAASALVAASLALTGCSLTGTATDSKSIATVATPLGGIARGGEQPLVGATANLYFTSSSIGYGYGQGGNTATPLAATPVDTTVTTAGGGFQFTGANTCPAGQFVYISMAGGNAGGGVNPNILLLDALGRCEDLYSNVGGTGTTPYTGPALTVDEATTVAAAYALRSFIKVTGNPVTGYQVGIGSSATNNASVGCVNNTYYTTTLGIPCATTSAAGMRHAFATANNIVSSALGHAQPSTPGGGRVPVQVINSLATSLQACVNSAGGGTNIATGATTITQTAAGGTVTDGTLCGTLFALTSYTTDGLAASTLTAATNTLDAMLNLAKRPAGNTNGNATAPVAYTVAAPPPASVSATCNATPTATCVQAANAQVNATIEANGGANYLPYQTTNCASGTNGTSATAGTPTGAAACIFGLGSSISSGYYTPTLTTAPPDFSIAVVYVKGTLSAGPNSVTCSTTPTTLGLLYPVVVATDINDNLAILNQDQGTPLCYNLITAHNDGTLISGTTFDNGNVRPVWISTDAFGHIILPAPGAPYITSPVLVNQIRIYSAFSEATALAQTITAGANGTNTALAATIPLFTAVDSSNNILITSANTVTASNLGFLTPSTQSHLAPSYTATTPGVSTTQPYLASTVDINNNFYATQGFTTSASPANILIPAGGAAAANILGSAVTGQTNTGKSANAFFGTIVADAPSTQGGAVNLFTVLNTTTTTAALVVNKQTLTGTAPPTALGTPSVVATFAPNFAIPFPGQIDGGNVIWQGDKFGNANSFGYIRSYETTTGFLSPQLTGCLVASGKTICDGNTDTTTGNKVQPFQGVFGLTADASGNLWVASAYNGQLTEVVGMSTPTWPLYIHNGASNKP